MPRSSRKANRQSSSSKKIIAYAMIGILAVAAVSITMFAGGPPSDNANTGDDAAALQQFNEQWCGTGKDANSSPYVTEVVLPAECEMPLGITVDNDGKVWYVSGKQGTLGSYSPSENSFEEYTIPIWPTRELPFTAQLSWSMSWTVKVAGDNVWFTDEKNNAIWRFNKSAESFEMFKVPARYPSDMGFDSNGNIYLIGIQSKSLYFGDVSKMKNGTSEGFTEIALPLDAFSGLNPNLVTSGSIVVDNERNDVWISLLVFQSKGQLLRYDLDTDRVDKVIDLPEDFTSPVGAALDNSGNLWVADHLTSTFFRYNPTDDSITKFVTSVASPKIYGGATPPRAYTLPYWIATGPDGSIWFNEHTGNKMAHIDPEELTLTEYWIPSQNKIFASCPEDAESCGIANALQFGVGQDNQVWFSEWTENKIGNVDTTKQVPISLSVPEQVTVAKGDSTEIRLTVNAQEEFSGTMMAAGTFTATGALGNSTGVFSEESVSLQAGGSKQVSFVFTAADDLAAGQYLLMIGAGNDDISHTKAVKVNIV